MSLVGLLFYIFTMFIFSKNPAKVKWRPVCVGISLQVIFGLLILRWNEGRLAFNWLANVITAFLNFTFAGTSFVYGFLVEPPNICGLNLFPVFAFSVLPTVIFFSSFVNILYYYGAMQFLVAKFSSIMQLAMGTTAAESLSSASNIFIGQTESPLLIKPYLPKLTKSELHAVMTGGFATIAGSVFNVYVSFGRTSDPEDQSVHRSDNTLNKLQKVILSVYKSHQTIISQGLIVLCAALLICFLIVGSILNFEKTLPLLVICILVAFALFYGYIFEPYCGSKLDTVISGIQFKLRHCWGQKAVKWTLLSALILLIIGLLIWDNHKNWFRLMSLVGLLFYIFTMFIFSKNPAKVKWRPVCVGISLQVIFGLLILRWNEGRLAFNWLANVITAFLNFTFAGTSFVYGFLVEPPNICGLNLFPVFAFSVLPTVIFFSSFVNILYYYGAMQFLVAKFSSIMQLAMGTTAAESLSSASNIFIGQTESPLLIKPYLPKLTKSELHAVMTGGFATIAGSVFNVYVSFGACANHILSASFMSAPAAMAVSKLFYPETKKSHTKELKDLQLQFNTEKTALEAAANGANNGILLVLNIIANLIAFMAFLAFLDWGVGWLGAMVNYPQLTFKVLLSWLFYPLAFLMGASQSHDELLIVAELMGLKTFINEFVAYQRMKTYIDEGKLSPRAQLISIYALCGFSNIAAIGIQLGGIGAMCPERKADIASVAVRAMIAGSVACFMTACIAGLLTDGVSECIRLDNGISSNCTRLT